MLLKRKSSGRINLGLGSYSYQLQSYFVDGWYKRVKKIGGLCSGCKFINYKGICIRKSYCYSWSTENFRYIPVKDAT